MIELEDEIDKAVDYIMKKGARYTDIQIEEIGETVIDLRDDTIREMSYGIERGIGVRVLYNNSWGFASANIDRVPKSKKTFEDAFKLAKISAEKCKREKIDLASVEVIRDNVKINAGNPTDVGIEEKVGVVNDSYRAAKEQSNRIKSVIVVYSDGYAKCVFANTEGTFIVSELPAVYLSVRAISKLHGTIQEGRESIGAVAGFEFVEKEDPQIMGQRAADKAVRLLDAELPPAGRHSVVMDNELVGVFMHEALGHAAEADHVIAGESILENKLGERLASDFLSVADDPSIKDSFGYYKYDDEGVRAEKKRIIEKGVLKTYLHNRETAGKLNGMPGNARAEGYAEMPIPRMSNIVVEPGEWTFREMVEDMKSGIYACGMKGGEVDTIRGEFQFSAEEAFLIENGNLSQRLKNVSLSGKTLDVLRGIDAVGKNVKRGSIGYCGKNDQLVPVSEYAPHLRAREILIGGAT
jgi:TldD protein